MDQTQRFAADGLLQDYAFYPKRINDLVVNENLIKPWLLENNNPLTAFTLPGCSPLWEINLRQDCELKHIPMTFELCCGFAPHWEILWEAVERCTTQNLESIVTGARHLGIPVKSTDFEMELILEDEPLKAIDQLKKTDESFNLVYLDYCSSWNREFIETIDVLCEGDKLQEKSLLGVTVNLRCRGSETPEDIGMRLYAIDELDGVEIETDSHITGVTDHMKTWFLGGAQWTQAMFEAKGVTADLKLVRSYRNTTTDPNKLANRNSIMGTLWFELKK